jgi:phytoene dehydrogenase-like protein
MTMSAYDYLSRWFESDVIKAVFAYYASIGTYAGPKSPGSAYVIMHHLMGEHEGAGGWGFVRGGMGSISQAIGRAGARHGLETRTNAEVARVLLSDRQASGVVTAGGEEIRARAVACNANCKVLFEQLLPADALPPEFLDEIRSFRTFSTAFKINAACEAPPRYTAFDRAKAGFEYPAYVHIGPDIDYLERAYDDAKHGWYSSQPFVTPVVPTTVDDTIAPAGKHVCTCSAATRRMSSKMALGSRSATTLRAPCSRPSIASRPDFQVRSSTCRSWHHPTSSAF